MYKKDVLKKYSPSNIYLSNNTVDWETFDLRALIQNFQTVECFDTYFEKYISILENNFFSRETLHFNLFFFNLSSFIYHDLPYTYKKKILKIVVFSLLEEYMGAFTPYWSFLFIFFLFFFFFHSPQHVQNPGFFVDKSSF